MLTDINNNNKNGVIKTIKDVRLPTARVMEWQDRGVLHVHVIVRGHIPTYIVEKAVNGSSPTSTRRRVMPAEHEGQRWGEQFDVRHINSSDHSQLAKLGGYITKVVGYALKDVTAHGKEERKGKERFNNRLRSTTNSVVDCKKTSAECDASPELQSMGSVVRSHRRQKQFCIKHRRAHHQLGFTGNVLTLNRAWGSSLKRARETRIAFASGRSPIQRNAVKAVRFNTVKKLVTHEVCKRSKIVVFDPLAFRKYPPTVRKSEKPISSRT